MIAVCATGRPAFVATLRGTRRPATPGHVARMQSLAPLAPLMVALRIRIQGITLWLRRVPVVAQMNVDPRRKPFGRNRFDVGGPRSRMCRPARWPRCRRSSPTACCAGRLHDCRCDSSTLTARRSEAATRPSPTLVIRQPDRWPAASAGTA